MEYTIWIHTYEKNVVESEGSKVLYQFYLSSFNPMGGLHAMKLGTGIFYSVVFICLTA